MGADSRTRRGGARCAVWVAGSRDGGLMFGPDCCCDIDSGQAYERGYRAENGLTMPLIRGGAYPPPLKQQKQLLRPGGAECGRARRSRVDGLRMTIGSRSSVNTFT